MGNQGAYMQQMGRPAGVPDLHGAGLAAGDLRAPSPYGQDGLSLMQMQQKQALMQQQQQQQKARVVVEGRGHPFDPMLFCL